MSDPLFVGQLFKVLRVDTDDLTIHFQTQNGQTGRVSGLEGIAEVKPGDVIIVGQNDWEFAPEDVWHESSQIAAVRRVLDDGSVLVDSGVGFQRVRNSSKAAVKPGNMVEYSDARGVISVVSERPIKSGLFGNDTENVEAEYLFCKGSGGRGRRTHDFSEKNSA